MSGRSCKAEAEAQLAAVDSTLKGKEAECAAKAEATQATLKEDNTKLVKNKKLTGKLTTEAAAAAASAAATSLTKSYYEAATAAAAGAVEVKMQAAAATSLLLRSFGNAALFDETPVKQLMPLLRAAHDAGAKVAAEAIAKAI